MQAKLAVAALRKAMCDADRLLLGSESSVASELAHEVWGRFTRTSDPASDAESPMAS